MNTTFFILRLIALSFLIAFGVSLSFATTVSTPAASSLRWLIAALEGEIDRGTNLSLITMGQIMASINDPDKVVMVDEMAQGKFTDRFMLLEGHGPIEPSTKDKMVAFTTYQISEDRRSSLGRYVIWENTTRSFDNRLTQDWVDESRFRELLSAAQIPYVNKGVWKQPNTKEISSFHVRGKDDSVSQSSQAVPDPKVRATSTLDPATKTPIETLSSSGNEPVSSSSWSFVAVVVAGLLGLFWWLFGKRK